jgi:homoserine dehydrogenase
VKSGGALIQLGMGRVGRALIRHYLEQGSRYPRLRYLGLGDRSGLWLAPDGWDRDSLAGAEAFKDSGMPITRWRPDRGRAEVVPGSEAYTPDLLWRLDELGIRRGIVVDATPPGSDTAALLLDLKRAGYDIVLTSKGPLAGSQALYSALTGPGRGRVVWEAATGARVALAATLRRARSGGEPMAGIVAASDMALNVIIGAVTQGRPFSAAARAAGEQGLLGTDPRESLSGRAAARTALILARGVGHALEPAELRLRPLLPSGFDALPPQAVWDRLGDLDASFAERAWLAGERGQALVFLTRIGAHGVSVGLEELRAEDVPASLVDGDTLVILYPAGAPGRPVVIVGPGPSPGAVAAAAFADIVSLL